LKNLNFEEWQKILKKSFPPGAEEATTPKEKTQKKQATRTTI